MSSKVPNLVLFIALHGREDKEERGCGVAGVQKDRTTKAHTTGRPSRSVGRKARVVAGVARGVE